MLVLFSEHQTLSWSIPLSLWHNFVRYAEIHKTALALSFLSTGNILSVRRMQLRL
jgi:hypothetical protein